METGTLWFDDEQAPRVPGRTLLELAGPLAARERLAAACDGAGRCGGCLVEVRAGASLLAPPTAAEAFLDRARAGALAADARERPAIYRLACQARVREDAPAGTELRLATLRRELAILDEGEEAPEAGAGALALDPGLRREHGRVWRGDEDLGRDRGRLLGLALDLGTTTVVLELLDLETGRRVARAACANPQVFAGGDVIRRIAFAAEPARAERLRAVLREALNRELRRLPGGGREVYAALVVGNSTMRDLFFDLPVATLGERPFRSATEAGREAGARATTALAASARELGLALHPEARVAAPPLLAHHVGADATAAALAAGLDRATAPALLLDIGTNTEVLLADGRGGLLVASSPAGPAFEGAGVGSAMPGFAGAIERVVAAAAANERLPPGRRRWTLPAEGLKLVALTIGDAPPTGLCGSGLIDLLAVLCAAGALDAESRLSGGRERLVLDPERALALSEADLSALAQAKAAIAVGPQILLRRLGLRPADLDRLYVAGGFGALLEPASAAALGMLPRLAPERVVRLGNAALAGARRLLLARSEAERAERLAARVAHVELAAEPDFFDLYAAATRLAPWVE